jgi:serine protease Do
MFHELDSDKIETDVSIQRRNAITHAVGIIETAVVSVNVIKTEIVKQRNPFANPFFDYSPYFRTSRQVKSIGSGVIINTDGYIVTNAHVVEGATQIKVTTTNNEIYESKIIGIDSAHDIAVIKIEGENLAYAYCGNSSDIIIGEWIIAIGNPYGFLMPDSKPSVTVGVVSAVNRNFGGRDDAKVYKGMIQTDAAINPGNSGGPMVNVFGEIIGINSFIFSESGGSVGIGFAIPIDRVKKVVKELVEHGKIRPVYFGFKVQNMSRSLADYLDIEDMKGVLVVELDKSSPAAKTGLQLKDIIVRINQTQIFSSDDIDLAITDIFVEDLIELEIVRDGKKKTILIKAKSDL